MVAALALFGQLYVWWGHWSDASTAVWVASACAVSGALLGAIVPGRYVRAHVAIAAALMLCVAGFTATRVVGRWPFAWDAMPDPRYAGFIAVIGAVVAIGLVRGAFWARWAAIAFAAGSMLGGALNAIQMRAVRDEGLWLAGPIGVVGALTILSQLTRPGVREHFARSSRHALWSSRDRLVRSARWAAIANFAAAPMLLQALAREIGLRPGEALLEVGHCLAFPLQRTLLDVQREHIAGPAVVERALGIGQACLRHLELGEEHQVVPPGQLANRLLANWEVGPRLGKCSHILEIRA